MTAISEIVFTDDELTVLARMVGEPVFPATHLPEHDDATWAAVARGLVARGAVLDGDPPAMVAGVEDLLGAVLYAERKLFLTLIHAPGEGANSGEILCRRGDEIIRYTATEDGVNTLRRCGQAGIDALLAEALDLREAGESEPGPARNVSDEDFLGALELNVSDGAIVAGARYPAAAEYLEALDDSRRMATVISKRRLPDDRFEAAELTVNASWHHGLWLARDTPSPTRGRPGGVELQRVDADTARAQITALVATFGEPPSEPLQRRAFAR
ncbi:MAG: hypothetical protein QOD69_1469 [Solirubrobacteraceae bacterium]|nr:hypothetical protein [Solirubrobacteraceae bacterium]